MKIKLLYWATGIISFIMIIVLVSLGAADKISLGAVLGFIVFVVISSVGIVGVSMYFESRKKIETPSKGKVIGNEEAEKIIDDLLFKRHAEYPSENTKGGVREMGRSGTPIYIKICRGQFGDKIYGVVLNMIDTNRIDCEEFDDSEISFEKISEKVLEMGNGVAFSPTPVPKVRRRELRSPLTGVEILEDIPILEEPPLEEKAGDLK